MRTLVLFLIAFALMISFTESKASGYSFARRDFISAMADSAEDIIPEPEDSNCCDKISKIEAKTIIPGARVDSLKLALPDGDKQWNPNPTTSLFLSMFIPGGGQFYNRSYIKSVVYGSTEIYLVKYIAWRWKWMNRHKSNFQNTDDETYKAEQFALYEKTRDSRNLHLWLISLTTLFTMFDAYVDAHLSDFDQTDKAFEVYLTPEDEAILLNLVYNF